MTTPHKEITTGLRFPEGPVAMPDGSVILVEIARERQRSWRRLLRQGGRLEDRREGVSARAAQWLRTVAGREDALRRGDADRALLGLRAFGARRDQGCQRPLSRREGPRDRGPRRLPDVRFAGRR